MDTKPRRPKTSGAFLLATGFPEARRAGPRRDERTGVSELRPRGAGGAPPPGDTRTGGASRERRREPRGRMRGRTNRGVNPARRSQTVVRIHHSAVTRATAVMPWQLVDRARRRVTAAAPAGGRWMPAGAARRASKPDLPPRRRDSARYGGRACGGHAARPGPPGRATRRTTGSVRRAGRYSVPASSPGHSLIVVQARGPLSRGTQSACVTERGA